ncbi:hypothetical protein AUJ77_01040 [Candidatus Nomurabacteria bacterium CG1_02_43_90]|uniref:LysM domain-containing protein n=1 Tax=Candidatus Nomurabacteria bacterium CG1_02_43_90 TaxID=1805281 RepID=A0A1J4V4K4_9BACT|nr:MAG: hypothetical protein AUJ77_01040 [Candidatus Nomurabacteria bacterium CG1_02_43_90]
MGVGLTVPLSSVEARDFSFLNTRIGRIFNGNTKALPQNSQTIVFLEAAVNVDPNPAKGGGDITVVDDSALLPEVGPSGTIADIESKGHQGNISIYTVHKGDTLPQLAKMFGVSVNTILWANDLSRDASLKEGQSIIILPVDGIQYVVKRGDTVEGIARKYQADATEIFEFNNIESDKNIFIGDTILIPNGKEVSVEAPKVKAPTNSRASIIAKYPSYDGYYTHPVPAGHKTQGIHGYNAVDYGAPIGTPVYAAAEGTVIVSHFRPLSDPWFGGYGNYIVIQHPNGTQTLYGHLSAVYVTEGAHVEQRQPIGEVGSTGHSTGPHLHFEVRGARNPF